MTPAQLMRSILLAPVDLFWNGGIGTYVKAEAETNADVHDRANDALRVDGEKLRCKVVGEGGNLGFTQHGRVAFAGTGGRINTDFIDNSAGVDCSDHEVNIKILLRAVMDAGELTLKQRDELLASMTDEVGELVLRDNVLQNLALSMIETLGVELIDAEIRLMHRLEQEGRLDRTIEQLPGDEELAERRRAGQGLTRPERAVILAYAKMSINDGLLATDLPDRPYFLADLAKYFPRPLRRRFGKAIETHRLRREIVATWLANSLVNRGLHVIASELEDEAGATLAEIALGYVAARDAYEILPLWGRVEALPAAVPVELQLGLLRELRRVLVRGARWFLANGGKPLTMREAVGRFRPGIAGIMAELETVLGARAAAGLAETAAAYVAEGVEGTLARALAASPYLLPSGDIVLVAQTVAGDRAPEAGDHLATARVYFALDTMLGIGWLRERLALVRPRSSWERLALAGLDDELSAVLRRLTVAAQGAAVAGRSVEEAEAGVEGYLASGVHGFDRYRRLKEELATVERLDLAGLSVATRALGSLVPGG
jgi:glutamate dehydrogenase